MREHAPLRLRDSDSTLNRGGYRAVLSERAVSLSESPDDSEATDFPNVRNATSRECDL